MEDQLVVRTQDTSDYYVGDIGHCYGIDPETGEKTWALPEGRPGSSIVAVGDHRVLRRGDSAAVIEEGFYPEVESGSASMVAVDMEGTIVWEHRGQWWPVAVSESGLIAYRGPRESMDIALFPV